MSGRFFHRLAFKIGIVIVLIELVVLAVLGWFYTGRSRRGSTSGCGRVELAGVARGRRASANNRLFILLESGENTQVLP